MRFPRRQQARQPETSKHMNLHEARRALQALGNVFTKEATDLANKIVAMEEQERSEKEKGR